MESNRTTEERRLCHRGGQNKGYHLVDQAEEVYNQADIQSRLKTKWVGHPLLFFDSIDSTNIRAKLEAEQGARADCWS